MKDGKNTHLHLLIAVGLVSQMSKIGYLKKTVRRKA
jgi:hypothetical protein